MERVYGSKLPNFWKVAKTHTCVPFGRMKSIKKTKRTKGTPNFKKHLTQMVPLASLPCDFLCQVEGTCIWQLQSFNSCTHTMKAFGVRRGARIQCDHH